MGLFDRIAGSSKKASSALSPAEAFAAIALIAVASDGYISDTEAQALSININRNRNSIFTTCYN